MISTRLGRSAVGAVAFLAAVVAAGVLAGPSRAETWSQGDSRLTPVTNVIATATGTSVTIGWVAPTEPVAVSYVVALWDPAHKVLRGYRGCTGCTSLTWDGLNPQVTDAFSVAPYTRTGRSAWAFSGLVTPTNAACPTAPAAYHACVGVDAGNVLGPEIHAASGLNHSVSSQTPWSVVQGLGLTSWRVGALAYDEDVAAKSGAQLVSVLSDGWWDTTYTSTRGGAISPWTEWGTYSTWITNTVTTIESQYGPGIYFDIQNEPGAGNYYDPKNPPTTALVLRQYAVAYAAIKAADPNARVIGPATGWYFSNSSFVIDMKTFLDYAAANNLAFDAIAWHENGNGQNSDLFPESMANHIAIVRSYIAQYPQLGNPQIFVTEYGGSLTARVPGWVVGWMSALDSTGVAEAARSCFNGACSTKPGVLDMLLTSTWQQSSILPIYDRYAQMVGQRVAWVSTDPHVNLVAVEGTDGVLRLLVGRDQVCPSWLGGGCATSSAKPPSETVDLVLAGLTGGSANVHTELIPATIGTLTAPTDEGTQNVAVSGGVARLSLPPLADAAAFMVTITPGH